MDNTPTPNVSKGMNYPVLIILLVVAIAVSAANLFFLVRSDTKDGEVLETSMEVSEPVEAEDIMEAKEETTTMPEVREFTDLNSVLIFNYLNGWHVWGEELFDAPDGPRLSYHFSPNPIVLTSPREGGSPWPISIQSLPIGTAIYAGYEEADWEEYESDTITVQGVEVQRLRLTASEEMIYVPKYQEVLFVPGTRYIFEVVHRYFDSAEANDPGWLAVRDSIVVK